MDRQAFDLLNLLAVCFTRFTSPPVLGGVEEQEGSMLMSQVEQHTARTDKLLIY
jgi:hypothetical protein